MSSTENSDNWILGVTLGLLGSIAINTGNNVQSLGLKRLKESTHLRQRNEKQSKRKFKSWLSRDGRRTAPSDAISKNSVETQDMDSKSVQPYTSITWMIGTAIFVSGSLLNFASYAFAAQSMLASLESIQFVTNLIFGKFMLKANVTKTMLIGTCLTVMGTIMAVQFSSRETIELTTKDIKILYANPAYIIYIIMTVGMLFVLSHVYHFYERGENEGIPLKFSCVIIPVSYSIWSALFGTQSVVQAKVLAELLSAHSSNQENIFDSWFTYFTIVLWILTVAVWLSRLNKALIKFDPLVIIPLLQCSFIFFAIVSGGIFFKEFNKFTSTQWIGFWGGVMVMFSGLVLLTPVGGRANEDQLSKDVASLLRSKVANSNLLSYSTHSHDNGNRNNTSMMLGGDHCSFEKDEEASSQSFPVTPGNKFHGKSNGEHSHSLHRSPRQSMSQTMTHISAMKDVVLESANMLFLTPPSGTNALTDAMIDATKRQEERHQRMYKLKKLQELLHTNNEHTRETIQSRDILELVYDLDLEKHVTQYGVHPVIQELEKLRDKLGSPRTFRESMLIKASEMEKSLHQSFAELT
jgi:drug/metabolite transporter (DMT)-like permease